MFEGAPRGAHGTRKTSPDAGRGGGLALRITKLPSQGFQARNAFGRGDGSRRYTKRGHFHPDNRPAEAIPARRPAHGGALPERTAQAWIVFEILGGISKADHSMAVFFTHLKCQGHGRRKGRRAERKSPEFRRKKNRLPFKQGRFHPGYNGPELHLRCGSPGYHGRLCQLQQLDLRGPAASGKL